MIIGSVFFLYKNQVLKKKKNKIISEDIFLENIKKEINNSENLEKTNNSNKINNISSDMSNNSESSIFPKIKERQPKIENMPVTKNKNNKSFNLFNNSKFKNLKDNFISLPKFEIGKRNPFASE